MKLLYISLTGTIIPGVDKKNTAQISGLRAAGATIKAVLIYLHCNEPFERQEESVLRIGYSPKIRFAILSKILRKKEAFKRINQVLKQEEFDRVYMRYPLSDWDLYKLVRRYPGIIVFEHQTKEVQELLQSGPVGLIRGVLEKVFAKGVLQRSAGNVCVTDEIAEYEASRYKKSQGRVIAIGNGIDVAQVKMRRAPAFDSSSLRLIMVANLEAWHGLDRLIRGIANYKSNVNIILDVIGDGSAKKFYYSLSKELGVECRIHFHGRKFGEELDGFFDKAHIAIGCLGAHRKGLSETSTLKVREYFSRGIPVVLSDRDSDLQADEASGWYLQCESSEEPIDVGRVVDFYKECYWNGPPTEKIRAYAQRVMDVNAKMKKLNEFICDSMRI